MIPLHLSVAGFLSYCDPVEIDFGAFDLACIAGPNGAGKSSLLDAITWALFGQARKRDDALINAQSGTADVCFTFGYEGNVFRVQRVKPRDKTALLEFHILQGDPGGGNGSVTLPAGLNAWKPLTERTLRDTEARIQQTLRLDYETFVNASFFLQGKADQFTQQRPGDRKRILSTILGLEVWDVYRGRAAERRKAAEAQISSLDGRLHEINAELAEEGARRAHLEELQNALGHLSQARAAQETALESIRKIAATLAEQQILVETLGRQLDGVTRGLHELQSRLADRESERASFAQVLARAQEIEAAYAAWEGARAKLERWEAVAARFREHEKRRQGPLDEINAARAALQQELQALGGKEQEAAVAQAEIPALEAQLAAVQEMIQAAEARLARRAELAAELQTAQLLLAEAKAENPRLKAEMDELKERIDQLSQTEGALCPLCGQPLSPEDRRALIESLEAQGKEMGNRFRANKVLLEQAGDQVRALEMQITGLSQSEGELRAQNQALVQLTSRLDLLRFQQSEWESRLAPRREQVIQSLEQEDFAPEAHARLAGVDAELKAIGYDAAAHDADRREEALGRASQEQMLALEKARAALQPLDREIEDLRAQEQALQAEVDRQQAEYGQAATNLAAAQAQAPDLDAAERELYRLQEQENLLLREVGAAGQKVAVLDGLKARHRSLEAERGQLSHLVSQYKQLERAFGKDGVPALLIEQALPQIEARANEVLDRLSLGGMSIRFATQAAYKDKRRDDLKETLDILISDGAGTRDYEMFSGGEAFRVNFAIRLALSEVLAQRAGARLQTLVIDEGFGSQDAQGRQRLIEAINLVRHDFAKILVITHIDELKDSFPMRIEVEKTARGSAVHIF
jgi:DNA repair protein SbcC/Rad50